MGNALFPRARLRANAPCRSSRSGMKACSASLAPRGEYVFHADSGTRKSEARAGLFLHPAASALLALVLFLALACSPATAKTPARTGSPDASSRQLAAEIDPSSWRLGPEATRLYYYLLLAEGMSRNFQELISEALKNLLKSDPSLAVFQDGVTILLSREEFAAAEDIARQGLKAFPHDTLLTLLLAGVYSENGERHKAIATLEKHLGKKPASVEVMEELVRLYINEGQEQKASELLRKMPEKASSPESELFRAKVLSSVGRTREARESLLRLLKENPRLYEAWVELGFIAEREKEDEEAIKAYGQALDIVPDNPEILFRIAMMQIRSKLPKEAVETLEKATPSPGLFIQAALRFANAKYYAEAERMLDMAGMHGASPDEIALFSSMFMQESAADPLDALNALESISPGSIFYPGALQQRIRIYLQVKDFAKAHAIAREGRELFPEHRELWGLEAFALVKLKDGPEAEKLLKQALERYPDDEQILYALGVVQDESGKKADAMQTMERILTINPKNHQALNYVGYTLAEKNVDLDRALRLITAALEITPDADYIVDSLAWVQYRMGRFEEAWKNINRCISLGGDEAAIWEHYGDIALALDKVDEAVKGYSEALLREPENVEELRRKLVDLKSR